MAKVERILVEGVANRFDGSQAGIGSRSIADAHIGPSATNGKSALGDGVFDDCSHSVREGRLGNEAEVRIFIKTQTIGAKSDTSSFPLEIVVDALARSSNRC